MRLSSPGERYEFDGKFYLISFCAAAVVIFSFWYAKRLIDRAHGREVQELITKVNLATPESARKSAHNYVAGLAYQHKLTKPETAKADDIYADAFYKYSQTWIQDRIDNVGIAETRNKQAAIMKEHNRQFGEYLRSINKSRVSSPPSAQP